MKFRNTLFIITLVVSISFSFSCAVLEDLTKTQKPKLSVVDFKLTDISLQDVELTFDVEIDNPNPFSVNLASYDYDLKFNALSFVKGDQPNNTSVNANSKSIIHIPISFNYTDLFGLISGLKDKDETDFSFEATAGIEAPLLGLVKIPFSKQGTLPVVKAPKINIGSLKLANLSLTKADFEVELGIQNPNKFGLNLNDINYELAFNGLPAISGKTSERIDINDKSSSNLVLPFSVNLLQLGTAAKKAIVDGESFEYSLNGNAKVGSSLPFFKPSNFSFDRDGSISILK